MDNITDSSTFDGYDERDLEERDSNNDALEMSERKVSWHDFFNVRYAVKHAIKTYSAK